MVKKWNIGLMISLLSLLCLGLSVPAFAQTDILKELERFHMTIGLGYSKIVYPENFGDFTEFDTHIGGINYNVGLYYQLPANESISLGGNASGAIDSYSGSGLFGTTSMRLDHNLFAISSMIFPSKKFGIGPFARADVGLARMKANFSETFLFWEEEVGAQSDFGFGILLGGGIAFPITPTNKVSISANFSFSKIESDNYKLLSISLGYIY
jgi:hypothetical protein